MEQVDDDGGEEPGEQGQDVGQPRLAPTQSLLEPGSIFCRKLEFLLNI